MTEGSLHTSDAAARKLRKRYAAERRFRLYGACAIGLAMGALVLLLVTIAWRGVPAFFGHEVTIDVDLDAALIDPEGTGDPEVLGRADYSGLVKQALRAEFPDAQGRREKRRLYALISNGAAYALRDQVLADRTVVGTTFRVRVPLSADADIYFKGGVDAASAEGDRRLNDDQIRWLDRWAALGKVENRFARRFFVGGDSREPELAGIYGALVGSLWTLAVTLLLSFPLGVAAAVYLEEFAPTNRLTDFVEVNINNLAAVPSIVFGLLGLAVFLNFLELPRSAPLVGGMVLALMTLPTVIIASRSAIMAVPPSIREAALGVGASPLQVVSHHVLPLALPGILTGTIIGMARALGETAPLLMIGMVAFIVDVPEGPTSPATVLPVQIFLWADSPERAFVAKTSGAILVLLTFLVAMNLVAVVLRSRFERRW